MQVICVLSADPGLRSALQLRFSRGVDAGVLEDVYDGFGYQQHATFLSNPANISLQMNTDGVAILKSAFGLFGSFINNLPKKMM